MGVMCYWYSIFKVAFSHTLSLAQDIIFILLISAGVVTYFAPEIHMALDISGWQIAAIVLGGIIAFRLIAAPYWIYKTDQEKIKQLGKIDSDDLEHLLNGCFLGDTFIYKAEICLCKEFVGKSEIGRLNNTFTTIYVHAPKNSLARIRFQFSNGHPPANSKCYFYYLDQENRPILIENIYEECPICLDAKASFSFKISYDENYVINEAASLRIIIDSWSK